MIVAFFIARKYNYRSTQHVTVKEGLQIVWQAVPSLLLIIIVIGGIIKGIFTATEGSVVAVVYSLILSLIYKTIKLDTPIRKTIIPVVIALSLIIPYKSLIFIVL